MTYSPHHQRRSIRLKGYDYTLPGAYFVTICTFHRQLLFGEVVNGNSQLNQHGHIAHDCWRALPDHFSLVGLDVSVVMPNHIHGIVHLGRGEVTSPLPVPKGPTLGNIVAYFKYRAAKEINLMRYIPGTPVWQRNYYEHIIRNDQELQRIRVYIQENPAKWQEDEDNPLNLP